MPQHYFACGYLLVQAPFIKSGIISPLNCLRILVENQMTLNVRIRMKWNR